MKKGLLKVISLFLFIIMVFTSGFAGCGNGNVTEQKEKTMSADSESKSSTSVDNNSQGSESSVSDDKFDKKLELKWIVYNQFDNPVKDGTAIQKLIEEKFNVELEIPQLDVHNEEQWTLYWASGNTADHIVSNNMVKYYTKFSDQNIIRPITKEMLYNNAPDWMKAMESLMDSSIFMGQLTYKDKIWALPFYNYRASIPFLGAFRKSWMEKVGITKIPETLDELHNLLFKFTKEDPDGNGKNDTYGIAPYGVYSGVWFIWGTIGLLPASWYDVDGKVIYSSADIRFKEGLKILNKWYKEGIIDPEFITDTRDIQRAKWAGGKIGYLEDHPWWFATSTPNNLSAMITSKYSGDEIVYFPAVKGADGKADSFKNYPEVTNNGIYFGAGTSDEKVERILAIKNAAVADWDLYVKMYYGEKGETYDIDKDGIIVPKMDILTKEKISELGIMQTFICIPDTKDYFYKTLSKADLPPYEIATKQTAICKAVTFNISKPNLAFAEKQEDVNSLAQEFYCNAITGKINIDDEWEAYIKKLNAAGMQEILKEFEEVIVR